MFWAQHLFVSFYARKHLKHLLFCLGSCINVTVFPFRALTTCLSTFPKIKTKTAVSGISEQNTTLYISYLTELLIPYVQGRNLRSSDMALLVVPKPRLVTKGD